MASKQPKNYDGFTWMGTIVGAHGIRGEVKVKPLTDTPDYYLETQQFFLEQSGNLHAAHVETMRFHKNQWLLKLDCFPDRNAAEAAQWHHLFLPDEALRPLEDGEFFLHQLQGCTVVDPEGTTLGVVDHIMEAGPHYIYVVNHEQGSFLVPSSSDIVQKVDIEKKRVVIDPIEGLIE